MSTYAELPVRPLVLGLLMLALGVYGLFVDRTLRGRPRTVARRFYDEIVHQRNAAAAEAILSGPGGPRCAAQGGRIVERWNQRDQLGLLGQLGVTVP